MNEHRNRSAAAVAAGFALLATHGDSSAASPDRIFRDAREYTVRIRTQITHPFLEDTRGSFSGAGFVVDASRGWIATNAHVVGQSPSEVQVAFAGREFRDARKVYVDSFTDLAIVEVSATDRVHMAARLGCGAAPVVGDPVATFGHPLGIPFTGTRGIVSGRTDRFLNDFIQMDATIDHGNSGGPVIALADGRIVGIATAGSPGEDAKRLNLATPIYDLCRVLELLRQGVSPAPPVMEFSLLVDEDNRHTMEVAATYEAERWPFHPGDLIRAVGPDREPVNTYSELITALRGRTLPIPISVQREGREVTIEARPERTPLQVERRGLLVDGALISPFRMEDDRFRAEPTGLVVHSVEPGSTAEALGITGQDELVSVDGQGIHDIDALHRYLGARGKDEPARILLRRGSNQYRRWSDIHVRQLPCETVEIIGGSDARTALTD